MMKESLFLTKLAECSPLYRDPRKFHWFNSMGSLPTLIPGTSNPPQVDGEGASYIG